MREFVAEAVKDKLASEVKSSEKPSVKHMGKVRHLSKETVRISRLIEEDSGEDRFGDMALILDTNARGRTQRISSWHRAIAFPIKLGNLAAGVEFVRRCVGHRPSLSSSERDPTAHG